MEPQVVSEERIDEATVLLTYDTGETLAIAKPINDKVIPKMVAKASRAAAYIAEADPLFFKAQRGEATIEEWQDKVYEIRNRFPYPEE